MTLQIFADLPQRTPEWYEARRGIVTASAVQKLITTRKLSAIDYACPACEAKAGAACISSRGPVEMKSLHKERTAHSSANKTATTLIETASNDESRGLTLALAAERITEYVEQGFVTDAMFRGILEEPIARDLYAKHYAPVTEVGFMVRDFGGFKIGLSPDGLVGDDGLIEIKSRGQKKQLHTVLSESVPFENIAQCQAALLVSGRQWLDFVSYSSGMALYVIRVYPDARWQKAIVDAVRTFEANATEQVARYKEATRGLPMAERIDMSGEIRVA